MKTRSPRRVLGAVIAGVVAIAVAGWFVAGRLRSPADEAALRQPPKASLVTAPVERRGLTSTVAVNGALEYGSPVTVTLAGTVGSTGQEGVAGQGAASAQLVTRAPRTGRIREGRPLMEVNGRPVFALAGKVPMHRTITPGTGGADVRQLQRALRRLGYGAPTSGKFDAGTADAVRRWYRAQGYRAQEPGPAARQTLDELGKALQTAEETLAADRAALAEANDIRLLRARLANARADLRAARKAEQRGKPLRAAQEAVLAAEQALRTAERTGGPLRLKISNGRKNLDRARANLAEYRETYGVAVPPGEIVFLPKLPARLSKASVRAGDAVRAAIGTVTGSSFVVNGSVDDQEAELMRPGLAAVIETPSGDTYPARLAALGADARTAPEQEGGQANGRDEEAPVAGSVPVRVTPTKAKGLAALAGTAVTVRITIGKTEGEVLAVPVSAIVTAADGKARVQVEYATDRTRMVEVRTGLTADGLVQVDGDLKEGDRVVISDA
ncbi:peptidoglycan-binding protein [Spongiactinospora sp. TRM90649]|uniref:peptidoglycan-binding protein n=1 Tax=Spongiactinospora sp. TRM90649 TaxID=3031114 RepID=UPI0023F919BD|nr:peptidoglycan-binding protein [Spongiactinospora sp. TRM90649]MDF5751619.1 peptidoglycan-binding protein [Spongiactinospora sp. TRM90649]